jgi:DNA-binding FadR family transcriptional regulator
MPTKATKALPRKRKLSELIAEQLMDEIKAKGWPVGESIGTEAELIKRFNVSRATLIEATRQVEGHGAAVMRRGSGGGLFVLNSAPTAVSRAMSTYLELANVSIAEQYEASRVIETEAAKLAAAHVSEDGALELREAARALTKAEDGVQLHRSAMRLRIALAEASGSLPLGLFMRSLARVLTNYVRPDLRSNYRDLNFEHSVIADMLGIVEAIVAGDGARADHAVRQDVERREQRARVLAVAAPVLERGPLRWSSANKLNEKIAFAIRNDIAKRGWIVGERIANESELPERYGASPWVVRQAIRLLELHGVIYMRRGQGGGLFVGEPSPEYTVDSAAGFLRGVDLRESGVLELRRRLYQSIAQFAVIRATPEQEAEIEALLKREDLPDQELHGQVLHLLAGAARNKVLTLFCAILNRVVEEDGSEAIGQRDSLIACAEAVIAGDAALARRRLGRYLTPGADPFALAERSDRKKVRSSST